MCCGKRRGMRCGVASGDLAEDDRRPDLSHKEGGSS
jgi:hypothetical protein